MTWLEKQKRHAKPTLIDKESHTTLPILLDGRFARPILMDEESSQPILMDKGCARPILMDEEASHPFSWTRGLPNLQEKRGSKKTVKRDVVTFSCVCWSGERVQVQGRKCRVGASRVGPGGRGTWPQKTPTSRPCERVEGRTSPRSWRRRSSC